MMKCNKSCIIKNERGVALIIAIILVLVMSTLATTISFLSNNNFYSMSQYKRGHEAFLAAESCAVEIRKNIEKIQPSKFLELIRSDIDTSLSESEFGDNIFVNKPINLSVDNPDLSPSTWHGPMCRVGSRHLTSEQINELKNFFIPREFKGTRHLKETGVGIQTAIPLTFILTGKDSLDKDKEDSNNNINTGIEILIGYEAIATGGSN